MHNIKSTPKKFHISLPIRLGVLYHLITQRNNYYIMVKEKQQITLDIKFNLSFVKIILNTYFKKFEENTTKY